MSNKYRNSYLAANLTFEDDKITWYCPEEKDTREVMMKWETPIMNKMAEVAVEAGDHVLECGFGMGILSDAVQSRNPGSHTIVECHPEILVKLKEWAVGKSNINIIEGDWFDLLDKDPLTRYNAILMDTYVDGDLHTQFRHFCKQKAKDGCKISWWNWSGDTTDEWMKFYWKNVTFTEVALSDVPLNSYYNKEKYYVPLKVYSKDSTAHGFVAGCCSATTKIHTSTSETESFEKVVSADNILTCADPENPSLVTITGVPHYVVKSYGLYKINDGLFIATGNQPMIIKRSGSWINKKVQELVVGDKLYKIDNTEIEITKIEYDSSDENVYLVHWLDTDNNYFINDILMKGGLDD
jgi:hypothetical protein|tara:strand:+ start:11967 stop:13025 length:1059 start_codon:yes stop_codon:yes gene_type:complete